MRRCPFVIPLASLCTLLGAVADTDVQQDRDGSAIVTLPDGLEVDPMVAELIRTRVQAARDDPRNADAHMQLGMAYLANGLPDLGLKALDSAFTLDGEIAQLAYYRAIALRQLGDFEEADAALEHAALMNDGYAPVHWRRGLWHLESGELDAAEQRFRMALRHDKDAFAANVGLAQVFLYRREYQEAVELLNELTAGQSSHPYLHHLLANAYRGLGRPDEADAAAAVGIGRRPLFDDPWMREVNELKTGYRVTLEGIQVLLGQGMFEEAWQRIDRVRAHFPVDPTILNYEFYIHSAEGEFAEAMRCLDEAIELEPNHVPTLLNRSFAFEQMRRIEDAIIQADRAVTLQPNSGPALLQRARLALIQGDQATGTDYLHRAIQCGIHEPHHRTMYGQVLSSQGRWEQGSRIFRQVLENDPNYAPAWAWLGRALTEMHQLDAAGHALRRAEELNPTDEFLKQSMTLWRQAMMRSRGSG